MGCSSGRGMRAICRTCIFRPAARTWPRGLRAAATGPGTVEALVAAGVPEALCVAPRAAPFDSTALWSELQNEDWVGRNALVIRGDAVILAVREAAQTRHYEFNRAWARVVVDRRARNVRLALRSHGNEVEVGRYLDGGGRQRLARELKARLPAH